MMIFMELKTNNKTVVEEVSYGMFVWELPDGEVLGDGDGNVMNCFVWERAQRPAAERAITQAARSFGFPEGRAVWWSGKRPIDEEEYEHQIDRAKAGLTPDPLDLAAINEDARNLRLNG